MVAGVCGGLGRYAERDPFWFRLLFIGLSWRGHRRGKRAEQQARRAQITVASTDKDLGGGGLSRYRFDVRNVGQATATDVQVWLTDHDGRKVSADMFSLNVVLAPNDPSMIGYVELTEPVAPGELEVAVSYTDLESSHTKRQHVRLFEPA